MEFDYLIIGSGPAGTHAAYGLRGLRTLLIDAGKKPGPWTYESIDSLKNNKTEVVTDILGSQYESLSNLSGDYLSPKLKSPGVRYITDRPSWLPRTSKLSFINSYAQGGLGNAWGGGVYRFNELEMQGFLYTSKDLEKYYDQLCHLIGIQGLEDDLSFTCGKEPELLTPFKLTPLAQRLFQSYQEKKESMNSKGFFVGRPRLAILPEKRGNREPYKFFGDDFFAPRLTGLYSPYYTLNDLVSSDQIKYEGGWIADSYSENDLGVRVFCRSVDGPETKTFAAKNLLIGAGALNSAKIVLSSNSDKLTKLPLLENPISFIPALSLGQLGASGVHRNRIGGEALICHRDLQNAVTYSAFYGLQGPLRADLWGDLPFSIRGKLDAIKYVLPAMAIFQVFHKGYLSEKNFVKLASDGNLKITFEDYRTNKKLESDLIKEIRRLGFLSHPKLVKSPEAGSSIHYAGPLGMSGDLSNPYSTDANGKLRGSKNVYIIDSAAFPTLPSKNLTYTIMAHALKVADYLRTVGK